MHGMVFLSYKSEKADKTYKVRESLMKNNFSVWMAPDSIESGRDFSDAIMSAIERCDVCVAVLSKRCMDSFWVKAEILAARSTDKTVIPFYLEEFAVEEGLRFLLQGAQAIPAYENWEKSLNKLKDAVDSAVKTKRVRDKYAKDDDTAPLTFETNCKIIYGDVNGKHTVFEGTVIDGKRQGKGRCIWKSGDILHDVYEGDYKDDKRTGKGRMNYENGAYYEGEFLNGYMHGNGVYRYSDGGIYVGEFKNGSRNGNGERLYYREAKVFRGIFRDNKKWEGNLLDKDEKVIGVYRDGEIYPSDTVQDE